MSRIFEKVDKIQAEQLVSCVLPLRCEAPSNRLTQQLKKDYLMSQPSHALHTSGSVFKGEALSRPQGDSILTTVRRILERIAR